MGRAGQRHQLSTLLKDAQANRVALEERFARDKRTKKESGGKYGESVLRYSWEGGYGGEDPQ